MPVLEVPVQPVGETEQLAAFCEVQLSVAAVLYAMVIGPSELLALMSAAVGAAPTFTVTLSEAEPEALAQVMI